MPATKKTPTAQAIGRLLSANGIAVGKDAPGWTTCRNDTDPGTGARRGVWVFCPADRAERVVRLITGAGFAVAPASGAGPRERGFRVAAR